MVLHARNDHEFTPRTGNADRSIDFNVSQNEVFMEMGIVNDATKTDWKGVSYTTFLHEGTGKGYRKSKASSHAYSPKIPKTGYGIIADHFIVRAWDKYYPKMVVNVNKAVGKVCKSVMEA